MIGFLFLQFTHDETTSIWKPPNLRWCILIHQLSSGQMTGWEEGLNNCVVCSSSREEKILSSETTHCAVPAARGNLELWDYAMHNLGMPEGQDWAISRDSGDRLREWTLGETTVKFWDSREVGKLHNYVVQELKGWAWGFKMCSAQFKVGWRTWMYNSRGQGWGLGIKTA